jgi:hypothetical protein
MQSIGEIIAEFIEWAKNCGEDAFYIFEHTDEAIERFFKETQSEEHEDWL